MNACHALVRAVNFALDHVGPTSDEKMIEIDEPEFDVDSLARIMREEMMRRRAVDSVSRPASDSTAAASVAMTNNGTSQTNSPALSPVGQQQLTLQPAFQPHADHRYHVVDLLQYHDRNFIQNAYRAILKRGPDATGFKDFIEALRSGRLNKIDVLARLRYSSEGRAKKVQVKGLLLPAVVRQSYRIPVLGYLFQLCVALARLPKTARSQQQFEAHVLAQQEQIVDYANANRTTLANQSREVSAALARLNAATQASSHRQQQLELLIREQHTILDQIRASLAELGQHLETRLAEAASRWHEHLRVMETRFVEEMAAGHTRTELLETRLASEGAARNEQVTMLNRSLKAETEELRNEIERASHQLQSGTDAALHQLQSGTDAALEKQQQLRAELILQGQRVTRLLEDVTARLPASMDQSPVMLDQSQLQALADEGRHTLDAFYVSFEDQFRGSREEIKERLKIYLPLFERAGIGTREMPILDIGSGRGEWLELLSEKNLRASGVDLNRVLVAQCRERGLEVVEDDVMHYLRALPDASLGAVTGFHLVEHLPVETLIKMLDETVRVVKPGGACIFETPNPQNVLVGSCNFYFDPTHRNPLPGPIMKFLVESRGFARVEVINLNPSNAERVAGETDLIKRFNQYFYGPMDYAVVGWKV
jgi:SAM-dependent methyltransferase